ncbi:MAG: hypothetical protein GX160_11625 [Clostridiales bacterium]|nr:hypothetical protein [Clostridiales bacterium]
MGLYPTKEIVLAGDSRDTNMQKMLNIVHKSFLPEAVIIFNDVAEKDQDLFELVPYIKEQGPIEGKATVYICQNYSCQAPISDIKELEKTLLTL